MTSEKVTFEQAVQKLSEANNSNMSRLTDLENKLAEIHLNVTEQNKDASNKLSSGITNLQDIMTNQIETIQSQAREWQDTTVSKLGENQQQWNHLTHDVRDMRAEIKKICDALTMHQTTRNDNNQLIEDNSFTPHTNRNPSTINESYDHTRSIQNSMTPPRQHAETNYLHTSPSERTVPTINTIVIPPTSAIPTFRGIISENPRQFLIRVKEYAETINHWNDQSLLHGISQFLRDTALEWYCQLRTSHRRPQTWAEFIALFLNQFNSPMRRARQEQQWKECKQEENETINEFIVRLRAIWREQKPNETGNDLVRHLMCKMRNDILTMMGISRCESLDEIIIEAQKIEEILYQRLKQQRQNKNEKHVHVQENTTPRMDQQNREQVELYTMSSHSTVPHRSNQYFNSQRKTDYNFKRSSYTPKSHRDTNYSFYPSSNQRYTQSWNEIECYACGMKGHIRQNCPGQYNMTQQQQPWYYSKNDNGAQGGRDHDAPI